MIFSLGFSPHLSIPVFSQNDGSSCGKKIILPPAAELCNNNDYKMEKAEMWYEFTASAPVHEVIVSSSEIQPQAEITKLQLYDRECPNRRLLKEVTSQPPELPRMRMEQLVIGEKYIVKAEREPRLEIGNYRMCLTREVVGGGGGGIQPLSASVALFPWDDNGCDLFLNSDFCRVGIGITAPASILHINSSEVNTLPIVSNSNSSGYAAGWVFKPGAGAKTWIIHATGPGNDQGAGKFIVRSDSVDALQIESDGNPNNTNTYGASSMVLKGINNSSFYLQGKTNQGARGMRLHYLDESPSYPGGIATIDFVGDLFAIRTTSMGQVPKFVIKKNGRVGIGTEDPSEDLEVKGSGGCGVTISDIATGSTCLNLKNNNGAWHISGPRSYDPNNRMAIFWHNNVNYSEPYISFLDNGQIQIGRPLLSTSPHFGDYKLSVNGKFVAKKLVSTELNWADDEFQKKTTLDDLDKEQEYVFENSHLSGIPSAKEIEKNGIEMGEMSALQMREIEKLYKYMFLIKKENEILKQKINELEKEIHYK